MPQSPNPALRFNSAQLRVVLPPRGLRSTGQGPSNKEETVPTGGSAHILCPYSWCLVWRRDCLMLLVRAPGRE